MTTLLIAIGGGAAGWFVVSKQRHHARQLAQAFETHARALLVKDELLLMYQRRLDKAVVLVQFFDAPRLKDEWSHPEIWKTDSAADLAAFDQVQSQISNHIAEILTHTPALDNNAKPSKPPARSGTTYQRKVDDAKRLVREFENFEQEIVKKRQAYNDLVLQFDSLKPALAKNLNGLAELPQFPIEKAQRTIKATEKN